jgi:hypothetical protein
LMRNSIPKLLNTLRPTLSEIAARVGVSRGLTDFWRAGAYQPKAADRARLVKTVRKDAVLLLKLARTGDVQLGKRGDANGVVA